MHETDAQDAGIDSILLLEYIPRNAGCNLYDLRWICIQLCLRILCPVVDRGHYKLYTRYIVSNDKSDCIKVPHGKCTLKACVRAKHLSIPRRHFSNVTHLQWNAVRGLRATVCILLWRVSTLPNTLKTAITGRRQLQKSLIRDF